jgi:alpha-tubulin suppressor-like RCC1 family protein
VTEAGVECWGTTCEIALSPIEVNGFAAGAVSISAGGFDDSSAFACASNSMVPALPDETVTECWGANADGQLGTDAGSSNAPVGTLHVTNVSAGVGGNFACGLSGGQVYCWGDGASGQLGDGQEKSTSDGVQVRDLDEVTAVGAGSTFACALSSGDVYCWGSNIYGQLGNGDSKTTQSSTPTQVKGLSDTVTALSVGYLHACALLVDGTVECWGNNVSGQLGNGTTANQHEATPVAGLTNVSSIGAGWVSSCAVTSAGSVMCWGSTAFGTLGSPSTETSTKPVPSFVSSMATQVSVGATSACAVVTGELQCWGYLVTGNDTWIRVGALTAPVTVAIGAVTSVSVGYQSTCAVAHGRAECWGYNSSGQLGNGKPGNALVPMPVAVLP